MSFESTEHGIRSISLKGVPAGLNDQNQPCQQSMIVDQSPDSPMLELRQSKGRLYGLFARRDISRGTRILCEGPLIMLNPGIPHYARLIELAKEIELLHQKDTRNFFALYHHLKDVERSFDVPEELASSRKRVAVADAIFTANAVGLGAKGEFGTAVFTNFSRINHSCVPNAQPHWKPTTGTHTVHAIKLIAKGEEICMSYISRLYQTREERAADLNYHFHSTCKCEVCQVPEAAAHDARRTRLSDLVKVLEFHRFGHRMALSARTADRFVGHAEQVVELSLAEGIVESNLALAYRKCSKYRMQAGNFEKAVACAEKKADVEAYCIGPDASLSTAMISNGMAAQTWLGYVHGLATENRRAADIRQKADFRVQPVRDSGEKKRAKNAAKRQAKKDAKMEVRMEAEKQAKMRAEMRAEKEAMMEEKKLAEGPKLLRDGLPL